MLKLISSMQDGFVNTLTIFFLTLIFSIPLGMVLALLRMNKRRVISMPVALYILIMRGTPLMLQIFAIYFAIPMLLGRNLDRMAATILAFSLNYAAYFAEIFRGGIMAIPVGQHEACQVLGFTKLQAFFHVVLPQVVKRVLLPVSNEVITLVKDTSLANIIAVSELFRAAKNEASRTASVEPLFVAGLFYLLMNGVVTLVFSYLTKRFDYYKD
ncbi:MAG: amino acid ABC transporter permease [Clostridia bacterium]|nr:amino acid ABC transporter permease [Clostridia bacterium]